VQVGYADICNTAMLIEIAKKKMGYIPELSFGTHFFQDLVEADIRYLPLYPDDNGVIFNNNFLLRKKNILGEIFPEFQRYEDVVKVINIPDAAGGKTLKISMNAELQEAVAYLCLNKTETIKKVRQSKYPEYHSDDKPWRWRNYMAERLASSMDPERFGVKALYLFGSTNSGTAGPGSDIDLLVHFQGSEQQRAELMNWLEGWSLCLDEVNYLETGYRMNGLLDVHIVTDEDIKNKTSFAIQINMATEPASPLKMKSEAQYKRACRTK